MCRHRVNKHLIVLNIYGVSINKILVTKSYCCESFAESELCKICHYSKINNLEGVYMRPEMKYTPNEISFRYGKLWFTLLFIVGEIKYNSVSRVVGVYRPIKNVKMTEQDIETSMFEATNQAYIEEILC